jgi:hypothetical protein
MSKNQYHSGIYLCQDKAMIEKIHICTGVTSLNLNAVIIRYRTQNGRLGYDSDEKGEIILRKLLADSFGVDEEKQCAIPFDVENERYASDPFWFIRDIQLKSSLDFILTFHACQARVERICKIISSRDKRHIKAGEKVYDETIECYNYKLLYELSSVCTDTYIWRTAQTEATIITSNISSTLSHLSCCLPREMV